MITEPLWAGGTNRCTQAPLGGKQFKTTAVTETLPGCLQAAGQRSLGQPLSPFLGRAVFREDEGSPACGSHKSLYGLGQEPQFPLKQGATRAISFTGFKTVLGCKMLSTR